MCFFFFKQKTAYEISECDWSSDVCSSDLQRLVYWGAGRLLLPHHLNSASLTNEINQLLHVQPRKIRFDTNGAENATRLIDKTLHYGDSAQESSHLATDDVALGRFQ